MYENPFSAGYEVMEKSKGYSLGSAGSIESSATYLITNDFPEYTTMFYHPTEHENFTSLKYNKVDPGYDSGIREMQESLQGAPLEFYIPHTMQPDEGVGRQDFKPLMQIPQRTTQKIVDEIEKARQDILGKEIVFREVEEITMIRKKRKREVFLREHKKDI